MRATLTPRRILEAREHRAARQDEALTRFDAPLLFLTVVMPEPVQDGWLSRWVMSEALRELEEVVTARRWRVLSGEVLWQETGPEALYVMDVATWLLKSACVELEDRHPIGRLWNLDVITLRQGRLSRRELGFPARRCLVCEEPAEVCGRSRRHPESELWTAILQMITGRAEEPAA